MTAAQTPTAALYVQELRDGSWIGNVAWGGRMLTDGATDPELMIRRLVTRLSSVTEKPPEVIKLTRISQGGEREEREYEPGSLLQ